ncbi:Radial spoke head protein 9 [Boothiomyces sp. JEL0866]|nr:Radial spoke head protein 9 [Boothiomyces sp. JEL0866]
MGFQIDSSLCERTGQTMAELQELAEIFQLVDTDKGGTISRDELGNLMKTLGISANKNDMDIIMNEIDSKGTGEIDFESFVATVTKKPQTTITQEQLKKAFMIFDTYDDMHDGTISMRMLNKAFTLYSTNRLSDEDARELIREVAPQADNGIFDYAQFINLFNLAGVTLNVEERATLRSSLILKQEEEKLSFIALWGKLLGLTVSLDYITWFQLPEPTEKELIAAESIQGRLLGDPSVDHAVPPNPLEPEQEPKMKEDLRISCIVRLINSDVEIVPRKAYYKDSNMVIKQNPDFKGLEKDEIGQEINYLHVRPGFQPTAKLFADRMNSFDEPFDIFDSIASDQPKGSWSIQSERNGAVTIVRSLLWPGYSLTHTIHPLNYAGFYYGTGLKNHNIGYMI